MRRESHVRFCERLGVKLPGATLPTPTQECAFQWVENLSTSELAIMHSSTTTGAGRWCEARFSG